MERPADLVRAERFIAGIVAHAYWQANLADAIASSFSTGLLDNLPEWAWLELAALAQIRAWELSGLTPHLSPGLPTFLAARQDLADRLSHTSAVSGDQCHLSRRVFGEWLRRCSLSPRLAEGVDVALALQISPTTLEVLADFLWQHRART